MKIAFTSDIHCDSSNENQKLPYVIKERFTSKPADVFVLAGDIGANLETVSNTLSVLKSLPMKKILVIGNHDIWKEHGINSYQKLYRYLPKIASENNFHPLWIEPLIYNGIGFCGNMGWYDYSFRNPKLEIPLEHYKNKHYEFLIWMDKVYVRFTPRLKRLTDQEITQRLFNEFIRHYEAIQSKTETVVAVFHHTPFRQAIIYTDNKIRDYYCAFLGSQRFGEYILTTNKIKLVIFGHLHHSKRLELPTVQGDRKITAISSPFGYFSHEGMPDIDSWVDERLSYLEITPQGLIT